MQSSDNGNDKWKREERTQIIYKLLGSDGGFMDLEIVTFTTRRHRS